MFDFFQMPLLSVRGFMYVPFILHSAMSWTCQVLWIMSLFLLSQYLFSCTYFYYFSLHNQVLFLFKSEISIQFVLGTTVFYFLPCCLIIYFVEVFLLVCHLYFGIYCFYTILKVQLCLTLSKYSFISVPFVHWSRGEFLNIPGLVGITRRRLVLLYFKALADRLVSLR